MPERIQRRRTRGWRMPEGAVVVSRPSKWGNPIRWDDYRKYPEPYYPGTGEPLDADDMRRIPDAERRRWAVVDFKAALMAGDLPDYPSLDEIRAELRGKDLVCWCPIDQPCHADALLELANSKEPHA